MVDDAIRFVSLKSNGKLRLSSGNSNEDNKESKVPDYDEDEDQLEEEKQNELTNRVF